MSMICMGCSCVGLHAGCVLPAVAWLASHDASAHCFCATSTHPTAAPEVLRYRSAGAAEMPELKTVRSGPVGRILCIGCPTWQPFLWAVRYRNGSLPPTRRLARAALSQGPKALLRLPIWCCSGWRLPRFTSTRLPPRLLVSVVLFVASPRTAVSRHPALWSPDLPHRAGRPAPARLPGPLRNVHYPRTMHRQVFDLAQAAARHSSLSCKFARPPCPSSSTKTRSTPA
uniref:Uncharacterized protein n=1 Tax=mine drainage metagenome TaxID=410659 RepID=E6PTJ5_9ZZZZ